MLKNSKRNRSVKINISNNDADYNIEAADDSIQQVSKVEHSNRINTSVALLTVSRTPIADITANKNPAVVKNSSANFTLNKKSKKKGSISIGVAVQQGIKMDCHCIYPGNIYTNKPTVTDYLPSVYIRLNASKRWFLQGEFKYASPQYIEEFLYRVNEQSLPYSFITTSYVMKRVHSHELPVSFNYFVLPHFSMGTGVMYRIYAKSASQVNIEKNLYGVAEDSLIHSTIVKDKNDSNFVVFPGNLNVFFELQYQWRHFSFGARYAMGIQPYVKYTDPFLKNPIEKKSTSLNIFIRYELWKKGRR